MHTQEYKATEKQIMGLQLNKNQSKESQTRLTKPMWKNLCFVNMEELVLCEYERTCAL